MHVLGLQPLDEEADELLLGRIGQREAGIAALYGVPVDGGVEVAEGAIGDEHGAVAGCLEVGQGFGDGGEEAVDGDVEGTLDAGQQVAIAAAIGVPLDGSDAAELFARRGDGALDGSGIPGVGDEGGGGDVLLGEVGDTCVEALLGAADESDVEAPGAEGFGDAGGDARAVADDDDSLGHDASEKRKSVAGHDGMTCKVKGMPDCPAEKLGWPAARRKTAPRGDSVVSR